MNIGEKYSHEIHWYRQLAFIAPSNTLLVVGHEQASDLQAFFSSLQPTIHSLFQLIGTQVLAPLFIDRLHTSKLRVVALGSRIEA